MQPNAQAAVLNRVTGEARSDIAGRISANGQFFLVNPNGIQITSTGAIQAPGIVLSTLDVRNDDFMAGGALTFEGRVGNPASVSNQGAIDGGRGGFAALLGGRITNEGRIEVPLGRVALGAGERATLDLNGNGLLQIALPTHAADDGRAMIEVAGRIAADGGRIEIAAATARDALRRVVNLPGELQARSVTGRSGEIVLSAGDGGVLAVSGRIDVHGEAGQRGGAITATGAAIALRGAQIDASGDRGGGRVRIGGDREGGGTLAHARIVEADGASRIAADATGDGQGGNVVLWSDEQTRFAGSIGARGAGNGRGGDAEVSSRGLLVYDGAADLRSASGTAGATGTLLLDPRNVTISTGANTGAGFTAAADNTVINTTTLATALGSANVTVSTGSTGVQTGNITVANPVTWSGGTTLTLQAAGSITSNAALTANAGGGLTMNAGANITVANNANISSGGGAMNIALNATGTVAVNAATLSTSGGSFSATGTAATSGTGVQFNGSTVNVGTGTGTVTGSSPSGYGISLSNAVQLSATGAGSIALSGTLSTSTVASNASGLYVNGTLATNGGTTLTGTGTGTSGNGVTLASGASITSSGAGTLSLQGSAGNGRTAVAFLGGNGLTVNAGSLNVTGQATGSAVAVSFLAAQTFDNLGAGTFTVTGNSVNNNGLAFVGVTAMLHGTTSFTGNASGATGVYWLNANNMTLASGSSTITGNSTGSRGMWFNNAGNTLTNQGAGSLQLLGSTASNTATQYGLGLNSNIGLVTSGAVAVSGSASAGAYATYLTGSNGFQSTSGSFALTGTSLNGTGIRMDGGGNTLTAASGASVTLSGIATGLGNGVFVNGAASVTTSGTVGLSGSTAASVGTTTSPNRHGIYLSAGSALTSTAGDFTVSGSASLNASGIFAAGDLSLVQNGVGSLSLIGNSAAGYSVRFGGNVTSQGTVSAVSTSSRLVLESAAAITVASGSLSLSGSNSSSSTAAISVKGTVTLNNTAGGALSVVGTSTDYLGIEVQASGSITSNGDITLQGTSQTRAGISALGPYTHNSGTLSMAANSGSSVGYLQSSALTNSGTMLITSNSGVQFGAAVTSTGMLGLDAAGAVTQGASPFSAQSLRLAGTGSYTLTNSSNQIGTVAGAGASVDLYSASAMTVGSVLGQQGIATSGQTILRSAQSLTIASGATVQGASPVLAAGADFVNQAGSAAVVANSGRWLVYAAAPASSTFAGLDSGNTALWNASYATLPAGSVAVGGNRYLFASQQTLVFAPLDASKIYGSDGATALQSSFSVSGYATGVAGAFLTDNATSAYGGAPALSSPGTATTASVAGGPYAITLAGGSVVGSNGYATSFSSGGANLSVTARPITVTADAQSRVYGDANPALSAQISSGSLVNGDAISGSLSTVANRASSVGSYAITQGTLSASTNYTLSYVGANLAVTTRPITVTADAQSRVYGDANPALTVQISSGSLVNGDALSGALATTANSTSNVGSYAIAQGTLGASANYMLSYIDASLAVTARPITVSANAQSRVYGESNPTLTAQISGGSLVNGDALSGALATIANSSSHVGSYAITQGTLGVSTNYALSYHAANLAVTARPITVTADAQSRVYGDSNPALTAQISSGSLVNGDVLSGALATIANSSSHVGSYAITQGTLGVSTNYALSYQAANLAVTARPITVTADALSRVYGESTPTLTAQISSGSLVNGDVLSGALATLANSASNVGSYAIGQGTLGVSANYMLSYVGANLAVTPRPITVTADAQSRVYGDANPTLTAQISSGSLVNGDTLSGALATTANSTSNVGNYAIAQGTLGASANYALGYVGANLAVTPRPITVTADAQSRVYGDTNPALTAQISSGRLVNGDAISGSLATIASATSNVGSYAITLGSFTAGGNYALSYVPSILSVTPRALTIHAAATSRLYGDDNPVFGYQISEGKLVNGDAISGALSTAANTHSPVGSLPIARGTVDAGLNYALTYVPSTLTVLPRPLTVAAIPRSRVQGTANPALDYVTVGLIEGDALNGALHASATITSAPGLYAIDQGSLSASTNYALTFRPGVLLVTSHLMPPLMEAEQLARPGAGARRCAVRDLLGSARTIRGSAASPDRVIPQSPCAASDASRVDAGDA